MTEVSKPFDGKIVTNTLTGAFVQTTLLLGLPMEYKAKTTVNEHLSINADIKPDPAARPVCKYLTVGNQGHSGSCDKFTSPLPIRHQPTDVTLYGMLPHVLRPINKDLDDEQRKRFALRVIEEHDGRRMIAYYLRRIETRGVKVKNFITSVNDGQETVGEFNYSDNNLYPRPSEMPDYDYEVTDAVVPDDGDYVSTSATVKVVFDEWDIQEYQNVAKILYHNPMASVMSEFALCTGVDMVATGESGVGSPFQYNEAMGVQSAIMITTFTNLALQNSGISYLIDIGLTIPMALAPGQVHTNDVTTETYTEQTLLNI